MEGRGYRVPGSFTRRAQQGPLGHYREKEIKRINLLFSIFLNLSLPPPLTALHSSFTDLQGVLFFIGNTNQNTPETLEVNLIFVYTADADLNGHHALFHILR